MKSIIPTRICHSWTYVLTTLVIVQLAELSYSQQIQTRPLYKFCDSSYYNALNSLCVNGYDLTKDPNLASQCCSPGCALLSLGTVCKQLPTPTPPRFLFCDADFYTALTSLCPNTYDLSKNANLASQCCSAGCALSEMEAVCI